MSTFPARLDVRAAQMLAQTKKLVQTAHQRLNTIGSQVSALQPGDWTPLTLENGWSNLSGYIPAQVRIMQNGLAQITGHISGGTVSSAILIATLPGGYFNPVHAHQFTANVLAGAASVSSAVSQGSLQDGSVTQGSLQDGTVSLGSIPAIPTGNRTYTGTVSGSTCSITLGPGNSQQIGPDSLASTQSLNNTSLNSGQSLNSTSLNSGQSTDINYNTAVLELSITGELTLLNANGAATQLSFTQLLPLVTS
jgi:hypothetical protein